MNRNWSYLQGHHHLRLRLRLPSVLSLSTSFQAEGTSRLAGALEGEVRHHLAAHRYLTLSSPRLTLLVLLMPVLPRVGLLRPSCYLAHRAQCMGRRLTLRFGYHFCPSQSRFAPGPEKWARKSLETAAVEYVSAQSNPVPVWGLGPGEQSSPTAAGRYTHGGEG